MSLFTVGEIFVWMIIAALLGGVLGWLLRGVLRPRAVEASEPAIETALEPPHETVVEPPVTRGTIVTDVDVSEPPRAPSKKPLPTSRTPARSTPRIPPENRVDARSRVIDIAKRTAGKGAVPKDDLVLVHGIGPKIARLLEDMDITSFRQVARLSDEDVEDITAALEAFPGRIERDNWVGSARELHRETYGDDPLKS